MANCQVITVSEHMVEWARAFVEAHHVDVPFKKRKRKPYDPRKGGFPPRVGDG